MPPQTDVEYSVSLHPSEFEGYQSKAGDTGKITLYVSTIWVNAEGNFDRFVDTLSYVSLLERICLERAWQKIRMKNRCKPHCKLTPYADLMMYPDHWDNIRRFYAKRVGKDDG
jgi:hypothetical protein